MRRSIRSAKRGLPRSFLSVGGSPRSLSSDAAPALPRAAGSLLVWGRTDESRLGMRLPEAAQRAALVEAPILHASSATPSSSAPSSAASSAPASASLFGAHGGVAQIVCRASKTLVLCADGSVFAWGSCANLSLGHGERAERCALPRRVEALAGIRIAQIDAGETASAAVSDEGEVFTWGWGGSFWGGNGGLGHGNNAAQARPALVEGLLRAGADGGAARVAQVSVGSAHMLALTADGRAFSWGNGEYGRLGNGKGAQTVPEPVTLLDDLRAAGEAARAKLGPGRGARVAQVCAGYAHSLAVLEDGRLFAWGKNEASQLGLGAAMVMDLNTMEAYPTLVELEAGEGGEPADGGEDPASTARRFNGRVARVAAGSAHSLAITRDGGVWQWGGRLNLHPKPILRGELKVELLPEPADAKAQPAQPAQAKAPAGKGPDGKGDGSVALHGVAIAAGDGSSAVVDSSGRLFTWGKMMSSAVLGHPSTSRLPRFGVRQPTCVHALAAQAVPVSAVSLGSQHAAAITGLPRSL